jgi:hypothetical protein
MRFAWPVAIAVFLAISSTGCSNHQQDLATYNRYYDAQLDRVNQYISAQAAQGPMVDVRIDPASGKVTGLVVNHAIKMPTIPKYTPPRDRTAELWVGLGTTAIKTAGTLIGVGLVADAIEDIAGNAGDYYAGDVIGSNNSAGGDQAVTSNILDVSDDSVGSIVQDQRAWSPGPYDIDYDENQGNDNSRDQGGDSNFNPPVDEPEPEEPEVPEPEEPEPF